jgi:uncharacterized protein
VACTFMNSTKNKGEEAFVNEQKQGEISSELTIKDFQEGIQEGKIEGYRCGNCDHKRIDIMDFCPACQSANLQKVEFSNSGTVLTYTIQFVAPEQFMNEVPYAWAIIQLDNGPKVTGRIQFISKPTDLPVGQRVVFKKSNLPGIVFEKI